jgi:pimeloyl-ACP methyl ester carboxylesterase/DNA-binding SARP family transcriptional activator
LYIRLLGPFAVERAGVAVALPQSRKARALLALLASTGREHRRKQLCEWLWPEVDDPRAALRGALTRLRALVDDSERVRLVADSNAVRLALADDELDIGALGAQAQPPEAALLLCRGGFLDDLELPDALEFQAYRVAERERLGRLQRDLLDAQIAQQPSLSDTALALARQRAGLDPSDQAVQAKLVEALARHGRLAEAEEHVQLHREWLERRGERLAPVLVSAREALARAHKGQHQPAADSGTAPLQQEIHFCATRDGGNVAYAVSGHGPPLLKAANWLNHLEYDWSSPIWRHVLGALSAEYRLIRYDERGCGLSDRDPPALSLDTFVEDLESVARASGLERYPLLGISQGTSVSIAHAVRHPERVSHLILCNGFARSWRIPGYARGREESEALAVLMKHGWGRDQPAFRQVFTSMFFPDGPAEHMQAMNELQRQTATADQAVRMFCAIGELDVMHLLPQVTVPTLVLHSRNDGLIPFEEGRVLAAGIPNSRFVTLDSPNHLLMPEEPAFARFVAELRAFLATGR